MKPQIYQFYECIRPLGEVSPDGLKIIEERLEVLKDPNEFFSLLEAWYSLRLCELVKDFFEHAPTTSQSDC